VLLLGYFYYTGVGLPFLLVGMVAGAEIVGFGLLVHCTLGIEPKLPSTTAKTASSRSMFMPDVVMPNDFAVARCTVIDLIPSFGTKLSMISDERKGKRNVQEQAHGSADDRSAEATGSRS